jgi:hypothetical protein
MPFDESLDWLHKLIVEAGEDVNVLVERADDVFRAGIVVEHIKESIRLADAIVAVCTRQNPNVFFELGIADQWHWPIILAEQKGDLPFDIQHYRAVIYGDWDQLLLRRALAAALDATLTGGRKDRPGLEPAERPPRAEARVLGQFMSQVHVWGLKREGSLEHFPVDLLFLVQDVRSAIDETGRALAGDFPRRDGVIADKWRVRQSAEDSGLVEKNYDPVSGEWYLSLTDKARAFLQAYDRFSEEMRKPPPAR